MHSKPVLLFFGILILIFAWNIFGFWSRMRETSKNKQIVEDKIVALQQQKDKYSLDVESLNTEQGKEKFFRENLGLAKEGEGVIIVVEDKSVTEIPAADSSTGFISFLKKLFKF